MVQTEQMPPVISNDTFNELQTVKDLAENVYQSRSNFTELCAALEILYKHFDTVKDGKSAA
jgi:hypothetical protein